MAVASADARKIPILSERSITRERLGDLFARAASGMLFALLAMNLVHDFVQTRRVTGLLLLVSEALVVILVVFRRPASQVDRTTTARAVTAISMIGPPLLRAGAEPALLPDMVTAFLSCIGLAFVITAKLTLGRSFGLVPANRGVVVSGPYGFMRHPIYAGYVISHAAFLAAHPTPLNISLVVVADVALGLRALLEERTLLGDEEDPLLLRAGLLARDPGRVLRLWRGVGSQAWRSGLRRGVGSLDPTMEGRV